MKQVAADSSTTKLAQNPPNSGAKIGVFDVAHTRTKAAVRAIIHLYDEQSYNVNLIHRLLVVVVFVRRA